MYRHLTTTRSGSCDPRPPAKSHETNGAIGPLYWNHRRDIRSGKAPSPPNLCLSMGLALYTGPISILSGHRRRMASCNAAPSCSSAKDVCMSLKGGAAS